MRLVLGLGLLLLVLLLVLLVLLVVRSLLVLLVGTPILMERRLLLRLGRGGRWQCGGHLIGRAWRTWQVLGSIR
jgi:hypothetical protein